LPKDKHTLEEELRKKGIRVGDDVFLSPERLQTPLNVALGVSPLFLLGPRMLANISLGKRKIVSVCTIS
jgi:hypothetical protein